MDFTGKTAVVTGAASGMGKATAIGFAEAGANVALLDIDDGGAQVVADQIGAGTATLVCKVDLTQPAQTRDVLRAVQARFGRIDALANVAGIFPRARVPDVTEEFWDRIMAVNLRGAFFCCQEALRIMEAQEGGGAIVNVASGAAFRAIDGLVAYSASKAGLVGMTRVLALEYARKGVRLNVVAPGHTVSEASLTRMGQDQIDAIAATLVPGRWMTTQEQANAIIWACSDAASGLNGAIINVNGGNYMP
jgi:NAD(P)-dependent dehydrogenase (short-subunit alcohol dehydrogenase family)